MSIQHIVFVDIAPEMEVEFNLWYDQVHVPEILACPGWLKARRYLCLEGGPKYAAVYEIDGLQAYESPQFNAIKGFGPFTQYISNFSRICLAPIDGV